MVKQQELPIIQRTYDLILWYIPRTNKFPRDYKFALGDEMQRGLYGILNGLIRARYSREKVELLEALNAELEVLRYQTRLCKDFSLLDTRRYEYVSGLINGIPDFAYSCTSEPYDGNHAGAHRGVQTCSCDSGDAVQR